MLVEPGDESSLARFALAPPDIVAELAQLRQEPSCTAGFRFVGRRLREVQNTMYHHLPEIAARVPHNAAFLHPDDLARLGVGPGELVRITSAHGQIEAPAEADAALRCGVVSMAHGWGGLPGEEGPEPGVNTNLLTSVLVGRDPINAMPVMNGFPVTVERAGG